MHCSMLSGYFYIKVSHEKSVEYDVQDVEISTRHDKKASDQVPVLIICLLYTFSAKEIPV